MNKHFLLPRLQFAKEAKFLLLNKPKKRRKNKFHNPSTPIDFHRRSLPDLPQPLVSLVSQKLFRFSSPIRESIFRQWSGRRTKGEKGKSFPQKLSDKCDRNPNVAQSQQQANNSKTEQKRVSEADLPKWLFGVYKSMFNAFVFCYLFSPFCRSHNPRPPLQLAISNVMNIQR
jgi:hypothetical protein